MNTDKYPQKDVTVVLNSLKDIAAAVMYAAEGNTLETVLERIAQAAAELIRARYAALGVPDHQGGMKYFKFTGITQEQYERIPHLPRGRGLLGAIMRERKSIRLPRMQDDPRAAGFPPNHPPMTSLLGVPIHVGQQLFGTLYICDRIDGKPFTEEDQWLVETLAGYAALAIAGSQLREQQSRLALLEERERISMELHDGVIQSLYAIGMQVELMRTTPDFEQAKLGIVVDHLNNVIEDIRDYIHQLKYSNYHEKTIHECLQEIIERLHVPDNIKVEIDTPNHDLPFAPVAFEATCQIINEAISNAVRHANATRIKIAGKPLGGDFHVSIADNGKGFDPNSGSNHSGLGLRNMQQRVRILGGDMQIKSAPGKGTLLFISIPMRRL